MICRILVVVCLASACASPSPRAPRPAWANEASTAVSCDLWLARTDANSASKSWRLRAARRGFICLEVAQKDPGPALTQALSLNAAAPHTLALVERYLAGEASPERVARLEAHMGVSGTFDAAVYLGSAIGSSPVKARPLLKKAAAKDPNGQRGRRAMLALAKSSENDGERIAWLRQALQPHRSVLASFGHAEFGGLSAAAQQLIKLCQGKGDAACVAWAKARYEELER